RRWIDAVDRRGRRLPSRSQVFVEAARARLDFLYEPEMAAVFIDGPPHNEQLAREKDRAQTEALEDLGYQVIRFHHATDWEAIFARYPSIFGAGAPAADPV
ncbi:MAG: DUF559 domain-containing protein, partial [Candidatus Schekmanbacteria bacterium]|nr:DUF559 domain-containing protein [Candidatus Schekmanbacteria bacterium]